MFVCNPPQQDAQGHTITLNYSTTFGQYGIRLHTSCTKYQQDNRLYPFTGQQYIRTKRTIYRTLSHKGRKSEENNSNNWMQRTKSHAT